MKQVIGSGLESSTKGSRLTLALLMFGSNPVTRRRWGRLITGAILGAVLVFVGGFVVSLILI